MSDETYFISIVITVNNQTTNYLTLNSVSNSSSAWAAELGGITSDVATIAPGNTETIVSSAPVGVASDSVSFTSTLAYNVTNAVLVTIGYTLQLDNSSCDAGTNNDWYSATTTANPQTTTGEGESTTVYNFAVTVSPS